MSHTVGEKAALAVKNSNRKSAVVETRTPAEIIKGIRGNLNSPLTILKTDVAVLLARYDEAVQYAVDSDVNRGSMGLENEALKAEVARLNEKLEEFRSVYESENSSMTFKAERVMPEIRAEDPSLPDGALPADQA
jgi:hypothetical protein